MTPAAMVAGEYWTQFSVASSLAHYPEIGMWPKHKCHAHRKKVNECIEYDQCDVIC